MWLAALAALASSSTDGASCNAPVTNSYTHDGATLTLQLSAPPPSDLAVPIRGRDNLVYSSWSELPEHIGSPTSASFPLVVLAGVDEAAADAGAAAGGDDSTAAPVRNDTVVAAYARAARALLEDQLATYGAVHFRGLPLRDGQDFSTFVDALGWNAVKLGGGGTQRTDVAKGVRSASDEPPTQTIEPHGDMAHSIAHPTHIGFFCLAGPPPNVGGETVLTDMRGVTRDLEASGVTETFAARGGVAYHKRLWSATHTNHTGYTWQKFFFTEDLAAALDEVRKRDPDAVVDAHGPEVIDFRETMPVLRTHPSTGEPIWFNGVHTNHRSYYVEASHVDTSDGSPMDTTFADGTAIPDATIAAVRAAVWGNSRAVRLQAGELVVVDNYLAWHGRMAWVPPNPRKVLLSHFQNGPAAGFPAAAP